jgi:hypothetical protein
MLACFAVSLLAAHGTQLAWLPPINPATTLHTYKQTQASQILSTRQADGPTLAWLPPINPATTLHTKQFEHTTTKHKTANHYITLHYMLHSTRSGKPHSGANERLIGG